MYDSAVLTDAGRAFQARAAATGNAPSPSVVRRVVGQLALGTDTHSHTLEFVQCSCDIFRNMLL